MTLDRIEWHLWNWSQWMHGGKTSHLRDRRCASGGIGNSSGSDFDEMVEEADRRCAETTDVCIDDLPSAERESIYAKYMEGTWYHPISALAVIYRQAIEKLQLSMNRKGLV